MTVPKTEKSNPTLSVSQSFDVERIRGLLCSAFEGGSNYWYRIEKANFPEGRSAADYKEGGDGQDGKWYWHWSQLVPTHEGGSLIVTNSFGDEIGGKKQWTLDLDAIKRGLQIMAEKYPRHYGNFIAENDDADTGDVFLQCCLFGELVYG